MDLAFSNNKQLTPTPLPKRSIPQMIFLVKVEVNTKSALVIYLYR